MEPDRNTPNSPTRSPIDRFFSGLSEYIFQSRLGVADVQLVDYLSDMLSRFVSDPFRPTEGNGHGVWAMGDRPPRCFRC